MRQHAKGCLHGLLKLFAVLVILVVIWNLVFRWIFVDGVSMQPTLENGDWIVVCRLDRPERGDVIVTNTNNRANARLIKRLIAVGGDTVDVDYETGTVYVNGQAVEESYLPDRTIRGGDVQFPLTVPDGCVFLLGDNRTESMDSRYSEIGCIPQSDLLGTVWARTLPLPIHVIR